MHLAAKPKDIVTHTGTTSKILATMDTANGYWQTELEQKRKYSHNLTCSLTSFGRFRLMRGPMGFITTGDSRNLQGVETLRGLNKVCKIVDDILIEGRTREEHILEEEISVCLGRS